MTTNKRKTIITATFVSRPRFVVPKHIDIKSPDIKDYWVRWSTLYIQYHNGTIVEVEGDEDHEGLKHPDGDLDIDSETDNDTDDETMDED